MRSITLAALLFASTCAFAQSQHFGFKEFVLGGDAATVEKNPRFLCKTNKDNLMADRTCTLRPGEKETIAGVQVRLMFLNFYDRTLHSMGISFAPEDFDQVVNALKEKYGEAKLTTERFQNRMGATFENHTLTWRRPGETVKATQFLGSLDTSNIAFRTDYAVEEFTRRKRPSVKKQAKDL